MSLTLTVLGCAGSYPEPGNACSGYLVRSPGATVVVDLGPGTLANLQRHVELAEVDAIVLSHHHPDHWIDLPVLRNALRYYLAAEDLAVYGTAGVRQQAEMLQEIAPTLAFTTVDTDSVVEIGDQRFRFDLTDHPVETLAMRIESDERTLVYSADTGAGWNGEAFVADADLFLCEATVSARFEDHGPHLTGRQAGKLAQAAGVGRLVLTHIAPGVDPDSQRADAETAFAGPVDIARVGATFTV